MNKVISRAKRVRHRHQIPLRFVSLLAVLFVICVRIWPSFLNGNIAFTIVSLALGLLYFYYQDHMQTARFCKELVTDFNRRYDEMNNRLQTLVQNDGKCEPQDVLAFVDYFNLCAEEHLFHDLGYIYDTIWTSWQNGMRHYGKDRRVAEIWESENKSNSYYGFEFPLNDPRA